MQVKFTSIQNGIEAIVKEGKGPFPFAVFLRDTDADEELTSEAWQTRKQALRSAISFVSGIAPENLAVR